MFSNLQIELTSGQSLAVVGPNGSGKTTLLLTLSLFYRPTRGRISLAEDDLPLDDRRFRSVTSLVAPYLTLYDQLTAEENLKFFADVSGALVTGKRIDGLLAQVGLEGRGCDQVGQYSSGMKQRLKYALALMRKPRVLLLDEPGVNLDDAGVQMVKEVVKERQRTSIVIIATNDKQEAGLAEQHLELGQ